ncbi:MAG: tRNA pseudouridine(38-40) synthase TruA, partial [Spirochaetia bacterium]|nr:tRNA pseudouridine(38-40) synthase TruA [Spirochaetia bacterium]
MSEKPYNHVLTVAYRGTFFSGFQLQNGPRTVQGELEKAIGIIHREPVRIHCCGRTDAGVHATGQVVSFKTIQKILDERVFIYSLNSVLPADISVINYTPVPQDFHPRFSCLAREYEYLIWNDRTKPVHLKGMALWHKGSIPIDEINQELQPILGERDFSALTRYEHKDKTTFRYLDKIELKRIGDPYMFSENLVSFRIRGNSFLHNMIRIL